MMLLIERWSCLHLVILLRYQIREALPHITKKDHHVFFRLVTQISTKERAWGDSNPRHPG